MPNIDALREFFPDEEAERLARDMERSMKGAYIKGGQAGIKDLGIKASFKVVDKPAAKFFKDYSLMLSTKETAATMANMKSIMLRGLEQGRDIPSISRQLALSGLVPYTTVEPKTTAELAKMVRYRSRMIARTEVMRASNMGRLTAYGAHGVKKVEWLVGTRPCTEICADLEGNIYAVDEVSPPPVHPNCTCTLAPVVE